MVGWLAGRLVGWLVGYWLIGWLAGWVGLIGRSVGWLASWLVGWLVSWLLGWSVGWLVGWSSEQPATSNLQATSNTSHKQRKPTRPRNIKQPRTTTTSSGMHPQAQTHTPSHSVRTPAARAAKAASLAGALEHSCVTRADNCLQAAITGNKNRAASNQQPSSNPQPVINTKHTHTTTHHHNKQSQIITPSSRTPTQAHPFTHWFVSQTRQSGRQGGLACRST